MSKDKFDKNFNIVSTVKEPDVVFQNVWDTDARIFGFREPAPNMPFRRLPQTLAEPISPALEELSKHTSGGRCRFVTDSSYIAIRVDQHIHRKTYFSHMTFLAAAGFDAYIRQPEGYIYAGSLIPSMDRKDGYEAILQFPDRRLRDITLNFPLYDHVQGLELGVQRDAALLPPPDYAYSKPVVFYGSSITQGGCSSRPGTCYTALLSRWLDFDYYNFGFSGNGKGEPEVAKYLAEIDAAAFVLDYDYNAPDAAHLEKTHYAFYEILRKAHPEMPILIVPACKVSFREDVRERMKQRRDVIRATYDAAVAAGDKNVYWLEGTEFFAAYAGQECTVDGVHPNDLGFWAMAKAMEPTLRQMLR